MTIIVTIFYACVAGVFLDINDSRDISLLAVFHFSVYFRRKLYISDAKYEHFSVPAMFQKQHFRGKKLHKNEITLKDTSIIQAYSIYIDIFSSPFTGSRHNYYRHNPFYKNNTYNL